VLATIKSVRRPALGTPKLNGLQERSRFSSHAVRRLVRCGLFQRLKIHRRQSTDDLYNVELGPGAQSLEEYNAESCIAPRFAGDPNEDPAIIHVPAVSSAANILLLSPIAALYREVAERCSQKTASVATSKHLLLLTNSCVVFP
jgi:hypothetical protein